jgi:site-specific recombinase XerD
MVFITKFFRTAHQRGWIAEDPAALLVKPKGSQRGTTRPFDLASEEPAIMAAVDQWEKGILLNRSRKNPWAASPRTASALLLVLRYTGLRISDAVMFNPRSLAKRTIRGREIYCYFAPQQRKTEAPVFIPIPVAIAERIINAPWISVRYAFWDGVMPLRDWTRQFIQHVLDYLSRVSGVLKIHPHRFRDTFAVDLLSQGADIRSVSRLLGHKDVGTTLRYYEHYVPADQERLIDVVLNHWEGPNVVQFPGAREA